MGDFLPPDSRRRPSPPPVPPPVPRWAPPPANSQIPPPVPPAEATEPPAPPLVIVNRRRRRTGSSSGGGTGLVVTLLLVTAAGTLAYVAWPKLAPHLAPVIGPIAPRPASKRAASESPAAESPAAEPPRRSQAAPREAMTGRPSGGVREPRPAVEPRVAEPSPGAALRVADPTVPPPPGAVPPLEHPATPVAAPAVDRAAVEAAIGAAARALRESDWAEADAGLAAAEAAAGDDAASIERIARWRRLLLYAEGFVPLRDEALAASVGNEYTVDGKLISIVEANAERFIFRRLGRNVPMPPDEIPRAIVVEIVTQWFRGANRPANDLFLGAYHLCREEPAVARARAAWQRARRGGEADADQLLPLLDDPALVAPAP